MSKGRPPLKPQMDAMQSQIDQLRVQVAEIERQIAAMNDSFARGNIPSPSRYKPLFERWPSQNGSP